MEVIAAIIGAAATLITAYIAKKASQNKKNKQRERFIEKFVQDMNIEHSNVYILNIDKSEREKPFKFESEANLKQDKLLIILK